MAIAGTLTYKTELDTSGVKKSGSTVKSIIAGLGITKMISKAMSTISNSLDGAISRFDTLNNFPKVMSNLGISAEKSQKSIDKMSDKLAGLPTTLDQGAMAVQRFTSRNGDVEKSTDIFLALNNAILAGGASTEIQATALEQMAQAYAKGKPDMMEWRSIMTAMPAQLNQVAQAMGYGKHGADDLGEALRQGDVSMDKFMDTIVKLNTKGVKGFKSFEQQARNSTEGINTAIQVAKTQIVKGLTTIITNIDKSLKKSGTSIKQIITDLGKNARKVLENIGKIIAKIDLVSVYNTLKKLVPIIINVTTAWIAYHAALKLIAVLNVAKSIASTTLAFVKLIPSINSAKDAMTLLSMTFNANPIAVVAAGATALTTAFLFLKNRTDEVTAAHKKAMAEIEKENETIKENRDAYNELVETQRNSVNANMTQIANYEALYDELTRITDANGNVKKGYEERASFIVSTLKDALGVEINMTDGIIKGYGNLQKSIDKTIAQKKAKIILDSQEQLYQQALTKEQETNAKMSEYANKIEENGIKIEELKKQKSKARTDYEASQIQKRIDNLKGENEALQNNYNEQEEMLKEYAYNKGQYEKNMELFHKGQYDKMTNTNYEYIKNLGKAGESEKAQLQKQLEDTQRHYDALVEAKKQTGSDIFDSQIAADEKLIEQYQNDLKRYEEATVKTGEQCEQDWKVSLAKQLTAITGQKTEFRDAGNGLVQMYANGIKIGQPLTRKQVEDLAVGASKTLDQKNYLFRDSGKNALLGINKGLNDSKTTNALFSRISAIGSNLLKRFNSSLGIHSPSRKMMESAKYMLQGIQVGIEKNEDKVLKDVSKFGDNVIKEISSSMDINKQLDDMYKEMNKTIQMENAKLNFDVMSNNAYNRTMQLPAIIDLSANFEGTVPVQLNLDGEKIYDNQQKISVRKSIQYGGVK